MRRLTDEVGAGDQRIATAPGGCPFQHSTMPAQLPTRRPDQRRFQVPVEGRLLSRAFYEQTRRQQKAVSGAKSGVSSPESRHDFDAQTPGCRASWRARASLSSSGKRVSNGTRNAQAKSTTSVSDTTRKPLSILARLSRERSNPATWQRAHRSRCIKRCARRKARTCAPTTLRGVVAPRG